MTRESIFDPEGNQTEHSGSIFMGPRADSNSHLPPDIADGVVSEEESADLEALARAVENDCAEEAAKRDAGARP